MGPDSNDKNVSRLALGTVQLGVPYGINNLSGVPLDNEIEKIFSIAKQGGIQVIDTAIAYGEAETKIGHYAGNGYKVITKLPTFPDKSSYSYNWLSDTINGSLKRLQTDKLYGLLLHKPLQLLEERGEDFFEGLQLLKKEGKVDKIGISVYETSELDIIIDKYDFDIVQAPLNIFDRRLIETGWLSRLAAKGIEVHARSVFLQGLLLVSPEKRLPRFHLWNTLWEKFDDWLNDKGLTPLQACLGFALSFPEINNILTGVDNSNHLKEIIKAAETGPVVVPSDIASNDIKLINPLSWLEQW